MPETYRLRGIRVRPLSHQQIANTAISVCKTFKLSRKKSKSFDHFFESLYLLGIELKVEESDEWLYLTKGLCDPKRKEKKKVPQLNEKISTKQQTHDTRRG